MISAISRIFDPLGLLGPVTLVAKTLIQKLWQLNLDWDEAVSMSIHTSWLQLQTQLHALINFKIPRQVTICNALNIQIHGFSDASETAYGACIYIRTTDQYGRHSSQLLCSKSGVAPLRSITLSRLELCGALLLTQLMEKVSNSLRLQPQRINYWTDSTIVLHWIKSVNKRWNIFVANRISEIHRLSSTEQWYHVRTEFNPADHISRGLLPSSLIDSKLW